MNQQNDPGNTMAEVVATSRTSATSIQMTPFKSADLNDLCVTDDENEWVLQDDESPDDLDTETTDTGWEEDPLGSDDDEDNQDDDYDKNNAGYAAVDMGLDAQRSVRDWRILAVGKRPQDFIARDCLFGSLFRDHRVSWFHRYVREPEPWMKKLVSHLPVECQAQALQYVALHYLHKLHLIRMFEKADKEFGEDSEEMTRLSRLWGCPPCTVLVERDDRYDWAIPVHCCGLSRLCPWCFARKVNQLYACIRKRVLSDSTTGKYLILATAKFAEPFFGAKDKWEREDLYSIGPGGSSIRGYHGRYYGLRHERAIETRNYLTSAVRESADNVFGPIQGGFLTHQMGSAQDANERRTFLHDVGLVGITDTGCLDWVRQDPSIIVCDGGDALTLRWAADDNLMVSGLVMPADHPSALRTVLAGSSWGYKASAYGVDRSDKNEGIPGALSWQPTLLLDDQTWFPYANTTRHQRLYQPFGSWRDTLSRAVAESRETSDRRFGRVQRSRLEHQQQQAGNQTRHREAEQRRRDLLTVAGPMWPKVLKIVQGVRGRPAYRSTLEQQLHCQGIKPSRRDLEWLVSSLRNGSSN